MWYMDEQGERKRKSFSGTTKQEANKKITAYIAEFEKAIEDTDESKKLLRDSLQNWLEIVKFPSVEQTSYDRLEGTARCQIYPLLGDKVVGDITPADVKAMLNHWMYLGRSYSLVKKAYVLLKRFLFLQTELLETDATVCEIDAHFGHRYLTHETMCRHQKYTRKLPKIKIDAQKSEDCRS